MKLLLAHNYYLEPGGEDRAFQQEVSLLREHGHEVTVYTRSNEELENVNRLTSGVGAVWSWQSARAIGELVERHQPSLVHFHNTFPLISPSAYHAVKDHGLPVVQTLHNYRLTCPAATHFRDHGVCEDCLGRRFPWPAILHACYRGNRAQNSVIATMIAAHNLLGTWHQQVDAYVVLTNFMKEKLSEGGLEGDRIHVKANSLADPGVGPSHGERALFVGRLTEEKGIWTLLRAWAELPGIPLEIYGDGPLYSDVAGWIDAHSKNQVVLKGHRPHAEVLQAIQRARLLVLPSLWYEGLPNTLLEAFACGTPVLASRIGSLGEVIEPEGTGYLFTAGDHQELAATLAALWGQEDELEQVAAAGRREYLARYTPERNYQRLMEIYQDVRSA